MSRDSIVLNFEKCTKIKEVVNELNKLDKELKPLATNHIKIRFGTFVLPELLVVIASYIRYYRGLKYDIVVNEITPENNYLDRCDFYKSINYAHATKRFRFKNKNLKELTSVDVNLGIEYATKVCNSIVEIIKNNYNVEDNTYRTISFLLWELIDNILIHAKVKDEFNIIVQNHPTKKELTVCIVDKGIGIYNALTKTDGSKFTHYTPKTAMLNCINESITNGIGKGNGLYYTRRFIEENKGELLLYSGPYCLWLDEKNPLDIHRVPFWQGTIVCLKIKTENAVDLYAFFEGNIPTSITEHEEMIGGLW